MNIKTIIVEDEPLSRIFLKNLLAEFCPSIVVVATAATENEAVKCIEIHAPDLVFMDIELQQGTGFSVLQRTRHLSYHIIFTTALDYAGIRAIRYSGVDYIQKPIDIQSLQYLIDCMHGKVRPGLGKQAVEHLLETLDNDHTPIHLLVHTVDGAQYLKMKEILFIEGSAGGCVIQTISETVMVPHVDLKDFEKLLESSSFFRLHVSYIINLLQVRSTEGIRDHSITLSNGRSIPVSPKKTAELQLLLAEISSSSFTTG